MVEPRPSCSGPCDLITSMMMKGIWLLHGGPLYLLRVDDKGQQLGSLEQNEKPSTIRVVFVVIQKSHVFSGLVDPLE